jgi:glutathione gamma-glutamylcysteinyltransferase
MAKVLTDKNANEGKFYRRKLPSPPCVDFSSEEGISIFIKAMNSGTMINYFQISPQFRTQDEPAYCGITTLCMSLNALMIDPGKAWKNSVWRWYEESKLDCCVPLELVQKQGISLDEFACLAKCNGCDVSLRRPTDLNVSPSSLDTFRDCVKEISKTKDKILVVSYNRKTFGQTGSGHFSPIGGYEESEDMVLILDVARFKYPPHWVKLNLVHEAMCGIDKSTGKSRGYVVLEKSKKIHRNVFSLNLSENVCQIIQQMQQGMMNVYCSVSNNIAIGNDAEKEAALKNISIQTMKVLSEISHILQYVYVMRSSSSCCDNVDPTHLEKAERVTQGIESTILWQYMMEFNNTQGNKQKDVQKCCHKEAQATCIHAAIMLLMAFSLDIQNEATTKVFNCKQCNKMHGCDVLKLLVKENIIQFEQEILLSEAINLKVQIDALEDSTLFTTRK